VRNYKRMRERRVLFAFGVPLETAPEKLEAIPVLIRKIIEGQKQVRFERAHFQKFGAGSLDFESVYWMLDPDYNLFMDTQQAINLAVLRALRKVGVELANMRSIVVEKDGEAGPGVASKIPEAETPAKVAPEAPRGH
jgi:small-conductance mechanosensitive channel